MLCLGNPVSNLVIYFQKYIQFWGEHEPQCFNGGKGNGHARLYCPRSLSEPHSPTQIQNTIRQTYIGKTRIKPRLVTLCSPSPWFGKPTVFRPCGDWKTSCTYMASKSKLNGTKETLWRAQQEIGSVDNSDVGPISSEKVGEEESFGGKKN